VNRHEKAKNQQKYKATSVPAFLLDFKHLDMTVVTSGVMKQPVQSNCLRQTKLFTT
jgi:hypothetical protein